MPATTQARGQAALPEAPNAEAERKRQWYLRNLERERAKVEARNELNRILQTQIPVLEPPMINARWRKGRHNRRKPGSVVHLAFDQLTIQQIDQVFDHSGGTFRVRNVAEQAEWIARRMQTDMRASKPFTFLRGLPYIKRPGFYTPEQLEDIARQARARAGEKHPAIGRGPQTKRASSEQASRPEA